MAARDANEVGSPGGPAAGGGKQTPEQAAVTKQDGGGLTDTERNADWPKDEAGHGAPTRGGSSQGSSDRKPA